MDKDILYLKHQKLLHKITKKHMRSVRNMPTHSYEDIFQIASIGFLEACDTYNSEKGTFISYTSSKVNWYISNTLRTNRTVMKYPQYFEEIWRTASKNHLTSPNDIEKLVSMVCYTKEQVVNAMKYYDNILPFSLDGKTGDDENSREMYEVVEGTTFDESIAVVDEYKEHLTKKQLIVLEMLMDDKTQEEIAIELGISQSSVHRIVKSLQKVWLDNYE